MKELITPDGILKIPLHHGTSSAFCDSITKFGLGGRNVIAEWGVIELIGELIDFCEPLGIPDTHVVSFFSSKSVRDQKSGLGGFNYRHGKPFVSPSKICAANYAFTNPNGSEAIRCAAELVSLAEQLDPGFVARKNYWSHPAMICFKAEQIPILIEIADVPIRMLRCEDTGLPEPYLERIASLMDEEDEFVFHTMVGQTNFELLEPIPADQLTFFRLERNHDPERDFNFDCLPHIQGT